MPNPDFFFSFMKYFLAEEPLLFSTNLPTSCHQHAQEHYHLSACQFNVALHLLYYEILITLPTLVSQVLDQHNKKGSNTASRR